MLLFNTMVILKAVILLLYHVFQFNLFVLWRYSLSVFGYEQTDMNVHSFYDTRLYFLGSFEFCYLPFVATQLVYETGD